VGADLPLDLLVPALVAVVTELIKRFPGLGLVIGPLAWLVNTQAGYSLQPLLCRQEAAWVFAFGAIVLAAISLASAYWSFGTLAPSRAPESGEDPRLFIAALSAASGVLFSLVILLQACAAITLTGCER
jgi:hypothetical protein